MSIIKVILYVLIGYVVLSLMVMCYSAHHVKKTYDLHREMHQKWTKWFQNQDTLGWATKQGMKQDREAGREHEAEVDTSRYAYS